MDVSLVSLIIAVIALLVASVAFFQSKDTKSEEDKAFFSVRPLQLQAFERLVILCERISLPTLISRVSTPGLSARDMQVMLIETIKQEFDYNSSQQIYVTQAAWDAVRSLRDQNMLIINSISKTLPPEATSRELNKKLLEITMNEENAALHSVALDTLNNEAKKLMKY